MQSPSDATQMLQTLSHCSRDTHLLFQDLNAIPKSSNKGYLLIWLTYLFPFVEKSFSIDLEESRNRLLAIRCKHVRSEDAAMVLLYNRVVKIFNAYYPQKPLHLVLSTKISLLMKSCLRPPVSQFPEDLLTDVKHCSKEDLETYFRLIRAKADQCKDFESSVRKFELQGGKVVLLPLLPNNQRYEACLGINHQEITTVCHAGLFRSSTLRLIAIGVKRKLGYLETKNRVRSQFGIDNCYVHENDCVPEFEEAFGVVSQEHMRSDFNRKFGEILKTRGYLSPISPEQIKLMQSFNAICYGLKAESSHPKLFITVQETGFIVMKRFVSENKPPKSLKNVTVVLLPEEDFISGSIRNIPQKNNDLFARVYAEESAKSEAERKKFSDLSEEDRREVFWAMTGVTQPPQNLREKLAYYHSELVDHSRINSPNTYYYSLSSLFKREAFRVAYWKWSGAFQPVKTMKEIY